MFEINRNLASHKVEGSAFVFPPIKHSFKAAKKSINTYFFCHYFYTLLEYHKYLGLLPKCKTSYDRSDLFPLCNHYSILIL